MSAAKSPMSTILTMPASLGAGARCAGCVSRACDELESLPGVLRVNCDSNGTAKVDYDAEYLSREELESAVSRLGATVAATYSHAVWRVTGLD